MHGKKTLSVDCSAINRLTEDKESDVLTAAIKTAYYVRLTATNFDEVIATPKKKLLTIGKKKIRKRDALLDTCGKLLSSGECIFPYHWISDILVRDYQKHRKSNWQSLRLRSRDYEDQIARRDLVGQLSVEQRNFAKRSQKQFAKVFDGLGRKLEKLFVEGKIKRPNSFGKLLAILQVPKGAFWSIAAVFYKHGAKRKPSEAKLRKFIKACPPFHAFVLSVVMAEYGYGVRERKAHGSYRAGKFDLLSALYLPYCDIFVTDDVRQLRCLPEIAATVKLSVEILKYAAFKQKFSLQAV
jgi:hypothetical protein